MSNDAQTTPALAAFDALASAAPPVPPPLSAALEAELARLAPVAMRRPGRQLAILTGASLAYAGALLALITVRRDVGELPSAYVLLGAVAWFAFAATAVAFAIVPRAGDVMPRWPRAAIVAVLASVAFVALGLVVHPSGPSSMDYGTARFLHGHTCLELGVAVAIVPTAIGTLALRGALAVGSRWIAAALGAGGGCLGGLLLHFHCRIADPLHVAFMHGGVVATSALLAALFVPRVTDRPLR